MILQTLRYRQNMEVEIGGRLQERTHILPTKIIRVLSFAPDLSNPEIDEEIAKSTSKSDESNATASKLLLCSLQVPANLGTSHCQPLFAGSLRVQTCAINCYSCIRV